MRMKTLSSSPGSNIELVLNAVMLVHGSYWFVINCNA